MKKSLVAALAVVLLVSACGAMRTSKLNPFNWFGRSQATETTAVVLPGPEADARPLVEQVISMAVEAMPGGAIVRATGLPPTQAWWNAELVALPITDGKLVYDFRMLPPPQPAAVSTQASREITAAVFVSTMTLDGVTSITVQGALNARTSRR